MVFQKRNSQIKKEPWTHNVAYHGWVMRHLRPGDRVVDVGCGDGLLLQNIAEQLKTVAEAQLPGVRIRRGLYYRYLLEWTK